MVDVPRELVRHLARLLYAQGQACGTRPGTRALTCYHQALMMLVRFRGAEDLTLLAAGFGISRATAHRYRDEGIMVLATQARDLHTALRRAAAYGWSHVIPDARRGFSTRAIRHARIRALGVATAWTPAR
ncbi:transposase family protein [Salinispora mooreana]|nr:transposase family protein [Salinispora mooreana]